jgi:hypothetical protein
MCPFLSSLNTHTLTRTHTHSRTHSHLGERKYMLFCKNDEDAKRWMDAVMSVVKNINETEAKEGTGTAACVCVCCVCSV